MKSLVSLIANDDSKLSFFRRCRETTIIWLNCKRALRKRNDKARGLIADLEKKNRGVVEELFLGDVAKKKGNELVKEHFELLEKFLTIDLFTRMRRKRFWAQVNC